MQGSSAAVSVCTRAGREPQEVGAVLVCTCTSSRLIPSVATYLCGQLGIQQTYAAYDLVAACAGMPYGLAGAGRLLQEVRRPVLVVCVEKFSDKIGNVRPSRMIFGDGTPSCPPGWPRTTRRPTCTTCKPTPAALPRR